MIAARFDKERAQEFVRAFERGEAVQPTCAEGWRLDDSLCLAAAIVAILHSQRPESLKTADLDKLPLEHQEAHALAHWRDLLQALEFAAECTRLVAVGQYDARFESVVTCVVDGTRQAVVPLSGFKTPALAPADAEGGAA